MLVVKQTEDSWIHISSQSVKFPTTEKPTKSEVAPAGIMEVNSNNPNFPTRNNSDLRFRLAGVRKLMEPFIYEITRAGNELKEQNLTWVHTNETPVSRQWI